MKASKSRLSLKSSQRKYVSYRMQEKSTKVINSAGSGAPPSAADEGLFCPKGLQPNKGAPAQLYSCSTTSSTLEQEQSQSQKDNDTEDLGVLSMIPEDDSEFYPVLYFFILYYYSHKLFFYTFIASQHRPFRKRAMKKEIAGLCTGLLVVHHGIYLCFTAFSLTFRFSLLSPHQL